MAELLTLAQMARRLGVSQRWLRNEAESGRVPALKADRSYLFNSVAVSTAICALACKHQPKEHSHAGT